MIPPALINSALPVPADVLRVQGCHPVALSRAQRPIPPLKTVIGIPIKSSIFVSFSIHVLTYLDWASGI